MKWSMGLTLIMLFMNILAASAQKGTLRGQIIDEETGETLIGATIKVKDKSIGTTSDLDGNYSLKLAPGTHNIQVSFVSYETKLFEEVEIDRGEVTELNVNLGKTETEIGEVQVTAEASGTSENAMQILQKKSSKVMDGISFEQINKLGDATAAQALKRVTGVSVQDDKYIYVRGLGSRYTKITLNQADIPALDPEKNTVQMDIFPGNIIENIEVHKTFTPDMPGESTGGQVDVVTKDFPSSFTLQFSSSFGYNPQVHLNNNFLSYDGGNTDWLGRDDGTRDIPDRADQALDRMIEDDLGQIVQGQFTTEELRDINQSFNKTMAPQEKQSFLDHNHKFSIGNQTEFLGNPLGYNAAVSYTRNFSYYNEGTYGIYEESNTPSPLKIMEDERGSEKVNIAGLLNMNYKLSDNNKLGMRYLKSQNGTKNARYQDGYFFYENRQNTDRNLGFMERGFDSYQIHGKHVLPSLNKMVIDWMGAYTDMHQEEPDLRFFENLYEINNDKPSNFKLKTNTTPARFYRNMNEQNFHTKVNLELPVKIFEGDSKLKVGGEYSNKNRNLNNTKFSLTYNMTSFPTGEPEYYLNNYMISSSRPLGYYYTNDHRNDLNNSYRAEQEVLSAYGMINLRIADNWRIVTGARMENSYIFTENKIDEDSDKYKSGELKETDFLPSLNMTYTIQEDMNLRLGLTRTLARPIFKEIGTAYYDYKSGFYVYGNPDLQRALIDNLDVRWEYFFKRGEKIAVSGFYKSFQNPIEQKLLVETQNYEIKYVNSEDAWLYGAELEFRKKLDFVDALSNFYLGGNFAYIKSAVQIPEDVLEDIRVGDPDREDTRPMLGQAPYIVNAYLNYENNQRGLSTTMGFHVSGEKLSLITKGSTPYIYELPRPALNFSVEKKIGKQITVDASVDNILNSKYREAHHFDSGDRYSLKHAEGRKFSVGIKYAID
ncbi:MAG: TonB-dependent receptor domain-containing protein [Bacteroidota bacterium]